jgi:hypothetical protein
MVFNNTVVFRPYRAGLPQARFPTVDPDAVCPVVFWWPELKSGLSVVGFLILEE